MNTPDKKNSTLSRRDALKTIVSVTGAATLTQLPTRWISPILTSATLPAHAQTSAPATMTPNPYPYPAPTPRPTNDPYP